TWRLMSCQRRTAVALGISIQHELPGGRPMEEIDTHSLTRPDTAVYPLSGDDVDWFTGSAPDGTQWLIVLRFPDAVAMSFAEDGSLAATTTIPGLPTNASLGCFSEADYNLISRWFETTQLATGPIRVRRFDVSRHHIRIIDLPAHYHDVAT